MKLKFNKKILFIIPIIILAILMITVILKKDKFIFVSQDDSILFKNEYEELNYKEATDGKNYPEVKINYNNITYITIDKLLDFLNDGSAVVYVGYSECLYCRSAVQVLSDTAKKNNLNNLYYLNLNDVWNIKEITNNGVVAIESSDDKYNKLIEQLDEHYLKEFITKDTKENKLKVPLVLFIVDGNIVSWWSGTLFSHEDPYKELSDYQKIALEEIYASGIKNVMNS